MSSTREPSGFYTRPDAERARAGARLTVSTVRPHVGDGGPGGERATLEP